MKRIWNIMREFRWITIAAVLLAVVGVVLALAGAALVVVVGLLGAAIVFAVVDRN